MANKRLPLKEQLKVLYNTPEDLRGLNDLCIKMTGKTLGYGGIVYIQDSGEKKKDSIYLDKFKPGLYYCKANSTTTSNDTSIFIDYSNYTIGNKLENLSDYVIIRSGPTINSYNQLKQFKSGRYLIHFNLPKFKANYVLLKLYRIVPDLNKESDIFLEVQYGTKYYLAFINSNGSISEFV